MTLELRLAVPKRSSPVASRGKSLPRHGVRCKGPVAGGRSWARSRQRKPAIWLWPREKRRKAENPEGHEEESGCYLKYQVDG